MASILVVSGPNEGDYYPLGSRAVVIGRDEGCSIQIVDDSVSRSHVQVRLDGADKTYHVQDLKSTNGTFLNDRKITDDVSLADGDIIRVGHSELMFSALDFTDRDTAFEHFRQRGERGKSTIVQS